MRALILSTIAFYLSTLFCSCHSQKQVQSDYAEDVRLTNTTATTSSSQSLVDMVASWSADFDSLDIYVEPIDNCSSCKQSLRRNHPGCAYTPDTPLSPTKNRLISLFAQTLPSLTRWRFTAHQQLAIARKRLRLTFTNLLIQISSS